MPVNIVDSEGIEILRKTKRLIDFDYVRSTNTISEVFFIAEAKDFKNVNIYKELKIILDIDYYQDIKDLLIKYIEYQIKHKVIPVTKGDLYSRKISVEFYWDEIPVYVSENIDQDDFTEVIKNFEKGDEFLCENNPLLIEQLEQIYKTKNEFVIIYDDDNSDENFFCYMKTKYISNEQLIFIRRLKHLFPKETVKGLDEETVKRLSTYTNDSNPLYLNVYTLAKPNSENEMINLNEINTFYLTPENVFERSKRYHRQRFENRYYDVSDNEILRNNIERAKNGHTLSIPYNKEDEFELLETIIEEREKVGELDRETITEDIKLHEKNGITCPTAKEFFYALDKLKEKQRKNTSSKKSVKLYHTLDFNKACAFRVKLTGKKVRSIMIPGHGYYVYYRNDFEIEDVNSHEMKKIKAAIIDVFGLDKDDKRKVGELFQIKTINGEEVRDDASIIGYFSDSLTLGLKD